MTDETIDETEKKKRQPWPIRSNQVGLAKELLQQGINVGLQFEVYPIQTSEYTETK